MSLFAIEKLVSLRCISEHMLRWQSNPVSKHFNQLIFIASIEDWLACDQLDHDAAERPHIDRMGVGHTKSDLRATIISRLDISEAVFEFSTS